ncbi:hypothetical protein CR513_52812, partial [Mucuna pruriens]
MISLMQSFCNGFIPKIKILLDALTRGSMNIKLEMKILCYFGLKSNSSQSNFRSLLDKSLNFCNNFIPCKLTWEIQDKLCIVIFVEITI